MRRRPRYTATRGGAAFPFLLFLAVVFAIGAVGWMMALPVLLTRQLAERAGLPATVHQCVVNPFTGAIAVRGLVLENPTDFSERTFAEVERIESRADLRSQFGEYPVFEDVSVALARLVLISRDGREGNVERLAQRFRWSEGRRLDVAGEPPARSIVVRRLTVKIARLEVIEDGALHHLHDLEFVLPGDTRLATLRGAGSAGDRGPIEALLGGLVPGVILRAAHEARERVSAPSRTASGAPPAGLFRALEETQKP